MLLISVIIVELKWNGRGINRPSYRHREARHHACKGMEHNALVSAKIPSQLEPAGLFRSDGKGPDGMTIVPWSCGQLLVWDMPLVLTPLICHTEARQQQQRGKLHQLQRTGRPTNTPTLTLLVYTSCN